MSETDANTETSHVNWIGFKCGPDDYYQNGLGIQGGMIKVKLIQVRN